MVVQGAPAPAVAAPRVGQLVPATAPADATCEGCLQRMAAGTPCLDYRDSGGIGHWIHTECEAALNGLHTHLDLDPDIYCIDLETLEPDDIAWLRQQHPVAAERLAAFWPAEPSSHATPARSAGAAR